MCAPGRCVRTGNRTTKEAGRPGGRRRGGQAGSIAPLLALVVLTVGGLCVGLGRVGADASGSARARSAADAAALAGAAEGEAAARAVAVANSGALVDFVLADDEVEARVRVGEHEARARAARVGPPPGAGGGASAAGLTPGMVAALGRAQARLGGPVPITSGWRSPAQQQALWANREANPYPVARPGTSKHEQGLAVDVPRAFVPRLAAIGPEVGLCQPLPRTDPVHFELCPT